jgi:uncharacterized protein
MASSLLTLIDDIATLLDDVAVLSKVAIKKSAGVLGDDLALNAEQVTGVKAERELPVIWAVAKGSFLNKLILVPAALLISAFVPWLITFLLVLGGLFLCFEGCEKILHKFFHHDDTAHKEKLKAVADPNVNLVEFERDKIKGAIRTDFILSAEIIVIILGTVQQEVFMKQVLVVSGLALAITVFVYGLVAAIVKLDDLGLHLLKQSSNGGNKLQHFFGRALLRLAPVLMKFLSIVGTAAMFLVGGGILVHSIPALHHVAQHILTFIEYEALAGFSVISTMLIEGLFGLVAGLLVLLLMMPIQSLLKKKST